MTSLEDKAKLIIVQQSNKNDVLDIIGRPSTVSLFDSNDWFYIEREKIMFQKYHSMNMEQQKQKNL